MPLMHLAHCSGNSALCSASHFLACVPEVPLSFLGSNNSQINFLGGRLRNVTDLRKLREQLFFKKKKKKGAIVIC